MAPHEKLNCRCRHALHHQEKDAVVVNGVEE